MKKIAKCILIVISSSVIGFYSIFLSYLHTNNAETKEIKLKDKENEDTSKIIIEDKYKKFLSIVEKAKQRQKNIVKKIINEKVRSTTIKGYDVAKEEIDKKYIDNQIESEDGYFDVILTYYTVSYEECGKIDGITASGKRVSRGFIATPPNIDFGTNIYIKNHGMTVVEDRGGAIQTIYENGKKYIKIDIYVPNASQRQLNKLGKVYTTAKIINPIN
jgi:3D (Asp-Asp-Asp) domain-containing protein